MPLLHSGQRIGQETYNGILLSIFPRTRESGNMGGRLESDIRSLTRLWLRFRYFANLGGECRGEQIREKSDVVYARRGQYCLLREAERNGGSSPMQLSENLDGITGQYGKVKSIYRKVGVQPLYSRIFCRIKIYERSPRKGCVNCCSTSGSTAAICWHV